MAKDVITRFKLETTGFDSKIKQAAKELSAYSKTATQAKEGFNQFTKANIDAAKALGTMATSTTNVKDKVKELVGAYNEAAKAYEALTKEQQQSDWAKALAGSLTQLQQRIKETKAEMQGLGDSAKGGIFSGLGSKMEGALAVFGGNLMTKAAGAIASIGSEMADMVKQGVEMAKAGEGIRIAFERLGRGDILDGLREATHGTVTDLELMKAAVKFNDFKLPLDELGTMLAFAQQKAKDTGQSVDYMVDSIVTGLGRKSLMILDNLGLSATEIRERMKETGDMTKAVGAIIRDQMAAAGDYVETAADRAAQANVSLQNKMEELGRKFAPVEEASNQLWTSMKIGILDIIGGPLATMLNQLTEAGRLRNQLNKMNGDPSTGQPTKVQQQLSTLRGSKYKNANYKGQLAQYDKQISTYQTMIDNGGKLPGAPAGSGKDVRWLQSQMDALKVMRAEYVQGAKDIMKPVETNIKTDKAEQNVKTLTSQLKELEKQRKEAVKKGDQEQVEALTKQISQTRTNLGYLNSNATKPTKTTTTDKNLDAEQQVQQKINDLLKEALTADADRQGEIRQQVAELQKQQEKYKDIKNIAQGILPKDKEAVFTIDGQLSEETKKNLRDIENVTIDDKTMTITANTQEAMQKVQELIGQVSTTTLQMKVKTDGAPTFTMAQLEGMSFDNQMPTTRGNRGKAQDKLDLATAAFATGGTSNVDFSNYISGIKNALSNANLGDELYNSMTEKLKDATTVSTLLQEMMERGLAGADLESTAQALKEKMLSGDIDQTAIQSFLEELNKQIEEAGGVGLKLNADTGEVTDDKGKDDGAKETFGKIKELSSGLGQVASGLQQMGIQLPKGVSDVLGVVNGVISVIQGISSIISVFQVSAITANTIALGALTSAVTANTFAKFIPFFSGGGVVPAFAQGGTIPKFADGGLIGRAALGMTIPGNSMSGDNLRLPVDGGRGVIGVNSGEVILNRAQQGNLASQLEGGGMENINIDWVMRGEDMRAVINNNGRRTGRGEIVQSRRNRS